MSGCFARSKLFKLFCRYFEVMERGKFFMTDDKNKKYYIAEAAEQLYLASEIKKKVEKVWRGNKHLLDGVFIYLYELDDYFNPKLNSEDLFFKKILIFAAAELTELGKKVKKPLFPFVNFSSYKKKIVLMRQ